ncbi:MAG: tetratricopeptide repeat protein, partial [Alphaproteobacteria bacterium]|nr:tetratricopeptide repeat protein [Alphaproteobacteria bacterium]
MTKDAHNLTVTTAHASTVAAYNMYAADWIGYGKHVRSIFTAAEADPDCAFVNAHAAAVHMALEAAPGFRKARLHLTRARKTARDASPRERAFVSAVYEWWKGNTRGALNTLRALVAEHPADIVAAKWAQYLAFNLGDANATRDIAQTIMAAHRMTAEAWGLLAFGYEQTDELALAEEAARRALSLKRSEPWAHHALAHVMDAQGRIDEGIEFLTDISHTWADRGIFIREHNFWHLALMHLDRDEPVRALQIYDDHLWGEWPEFAQEQIGAISALWRLEMRGTYVGARWNPIVDKVVERWHEHILPFHDLHFAYALARGGRRQETRAFLDSMARHGEKDDSGVWDSVALPCAHGLVAYAEHRYQMAADLIGPVLGRLQHIGGSHAQRDVFTQTWIDAALKAGQNSSVADVLHRRATARP